MLFALQNAFAFPPPCGAPAPETILQNDGQPIVIYAYNDQGDISQSELELVDENGNPLPAPEAPIVPAAALPSLVPPPPPPPYGASPPPPAPPALPAPVPAPPALPPVPPKPAVPCKTETETTVTQEAGETIVHKPAHIIVNQPPTRLLIHHAPLIVKPSPLVLHQPGKKVENQITRNYLPRPVQVNPVYVRLVKPIEKKVLISKTPQTPVPSPPQIIETPLPEAPCDYTAKLPPPAPLPAPPAPWPPAPPPPYAGPYGPPPPPPPPCGPLPPPPPPPPAPCAGAIPPPVELDSGSELELPVEGLFAEQAYCST